MQICCAFSLCKATTAPLPFRLPPNFGDLPRTNAVFTAAFICNAIFAPCNQAVAVAMPLAHDHTDEFCCQQAQLVSAGSRLC
jgi:hypothetical protein